MAASVRDIEVSPYSIQWAGAPGRLSKGVHGWLLRQGENISDFCPLEAFGENSLPALHEKPSPSSRWMQSLLALNEEWSTSPAQNSLHNHWYLGGISLELQSDIRLQVTEAQRAGFSVLKLKIGRNLQSEVSMWKKLADDFPGLRWRLDFNAQTSVEEILLAFGPIPTVTLDAIEFLEDPCPAQADDWTRLHKTLGLSLAADWELPKFFSVPECVGVLVLKPAVQSVEPWLRFAHENLKRLVFTHCMDHPVGVLRAARIANAVFKEHPLLVDCCGLLPPPCVVTGSSAELKFSISNPSPAFPMELFVELVSKDLRGRAWTRIKI